MLYTHVSRPSLNTSRPFAFERNEIPEKINLIAAKKAKEHLKLPVALVTDNSSYLDTNYPFYKKYIDFFRN